MVSLIIQVFFFFSLSLKIVVLDLTSCVNMQFILSYQIIECYKYNQIEGKLPCKSPNGSVNVASCYKYNQPDGKLPCKATNRSVNVASCYKYNQPDGKLPCKATNGSVDVASCYKYNQPDGKLPCKATNRSVNVAHLVVAFPSPARIWGDCSTIHSPPEIFFFFLFF